MATIWRRAHLNVLDHTAFPKELLAPCAADGYAVVQVMLNPKHPDTSLEQVPLWYLREIRALGMKAWGFVWADDFTSPAELFSFCLGWRRKSLEAGCALTGFVINAEDGWEARDMAGERWSERFLTLYRSEQLTKKLSLGLNTYLGCGGINLPAWQRSARLYVQTFHEGNTHEWPVDSYIGWAKFYGWTKAQTIKPNWGTYKPYPSRADQVASAKRAGTIGYCAWYAEGAGDPQDVLIPLLREAWSAGVCF